MKELLRELKALSDPQKALADQKYHKSVREHWGVSVPLCDKVAKTYAKGRKPEELLFLAEDLWNTDLYDPMICASKIVSLSCIKPSLPLWNTIKRFLKSVDGWALEDSLAHAAWKCILADKTLLDELEIWTKHPNFWIRRATLIYTLPFAKPGKDPEPMLGWASIYSTDSEWFMQKAIGWWLRVLGSHNPERVILFLKTHW